MQIFKRAGRVGARVGALCLGLALGLGGCGSSGGGGGAGPISSDPLSGKIGGRSWTLATAASNSLQSTADQFWVDAYSESFTPCSGSASLGADDVILTLPKTVGSYGLSFNFTESLYDGVANITYGATSGQIVISDVNATTISGGASFAFNADNSVNGQFQATICP